MTEPKSHSLHRTRSLLFCHAILITNRRRQRSNPEYYSLVGFTVSKPWLLVKPYKRINQNLISAVEQRKLSDDILHVYEPCLAKLLGSPGYGDKPCDVSQECLKVMLRPGEIGYVLTHQALYFMFGEQRGRRNYYKL